MMLLDGHAFVEVSGGTFGTGNLSVGITLDDKSLNFASHRLIATMHDAITATAETNKHLPEPGASVVGGEINPAPTGLVAGEPICAAVARMTPNIRIVVNSALDVSPNCIYAVHMRLVAGH
jgi:hypothetical protein